MGVWSMGWFPLSCRNAAPGGTTDVTTAPDLTVMVISTSVTQQPPLEATGEDRPLGAWSVTHSERDVVHAVKDEEQRKGKR
jgi:hypothetical protein